MLEARSRQYDTVLMPECSGAYAHENLPQPIKSDRALADRELPEWASYIVEKYVRQDLSSLGYTPTRRLTSFSEKIKVDCQCLLAMRSIQSKVDSAIASRRGLVRI
jgi:hypothetical protein